MKKISSRWEVWVFGLVGAGIPLLATFLALIDPMLMRGNFSEMLVGLSAPAIILGIPVAGPLPPILQPLVFIPINGIVYAFIGLVLGMFVRTIMEPYRK